MVDEAADRGPEPAHGSLGGLSEQRLEFGEGVFDWIEVGAVGWEVFELGAGGLYHLAYARPLVARQVVHDDDVAWPQLRHEDPGDISLEGVAVDRPVEHPGSDEAAEGQCAYEGRCLPVAMRNADPKPLTAPAATVPTSHVRGGPGLVDEDEALRIEVELALEPGLALPQDIRAVLLRGVRRLFLRVTA